MTALAAVAMAALLSNPVAAQSRIPLPPPTELAERSDAILQRVAEASRPEGQDVESALARIDAVIAQTSRQFGENSVESVQVATEAGIALIRDWQRFDLARPHIERSLVLSRAVFGTDHRETAFAIQDVAVVRHELRPELFVQWSGPLVREAIDVRTRVLGADHLETAGSERFLADWLFESWRTQRRASAESPMLDEARRLADHAVVVFEEAYGADNGEVISLRYRQAQIALAAQDYPSAESLANELLYRYQSPCNPVPGEPGARQLLAEALLRQSRVAEAQEAMSAIAGDACPVMSDDL